jgi:hypothetical protein
LLGFWEKNVGPLDRTPALQQAILDIIKSGGLKTGGGGDEGGLLSFFEKHGSEVGDPGRVVGLEKAFDGSSKKLGDWGLQDWSPKTGGFGGDWGAPSTPSLPSTSFFGGFGGPSWEGSWTPLFLLLLIVAAAVAWRYWPQMRFFRDEKIDLTQRPWPVDPRAVKDREGVVRAFEYLSVQLCGDAARVWNHRTIAAALRDRVQGAAAVSGELAGLYELARYTPPAEPFTPVAIAAARRCLCHIAGVSPA